MKELLEELERMIETAKAERRKCWPEDFYEKGNYDGRTDAFMEVRHYIKSNNLHIEFPQ